MNDIKIISREEFASMTPTEKFRYILHIEELNKAYGGDLGLNPEGYKSLEKVLKLAMNDDNSDITMTAKKLHKEIYSESVDQNHTF
jgi:hypothetical protein